MMSVEEKGIEVIGIGNKTVTVKTLDGHTITCNAAVEAIRIPLQKLYVIVDLEYYHTYCIAIRMPKGSVEDCLLYDTAEEHKYVHLAACDDKDDYLVARGCDHAVGQEKPTGRFEELETWTRESFTQGGKVELCLEWPYHRANRLHGLYRQELRWCGGGRETLRKWFCERDA
jgi:hypothetical protein